MSGSNDAPGTYIALRQDDQDRGDLAHTGGQETRSRTDIEDVPLDIDDGLAPSERAAGNHQLDSLPDSVRIFDSEVKNARVLPAFVLLTTLFILCVAATVYFAIRRHIGVALVPVTLGFVIVIVGLLYFRTVLALPIFMVFQSKLGIIEFHYNTSCISRPPTILSIADVDVPTVVYEESTIQSFKSREIKIRGTFKFSLPVRSMGRIFSVGIMHLSSDPKYRGRNPGKVADMVTTLGQIAMILESHAQLPANILVRNFDVTKPLPVQFQPQAGDAPVFGHNPDDDLELR